MFRRLVPEAAAKDDSTREHVDRVSTAFLVLRPDLFPSFVSVVQTIVFSPAFRDSDHNCTPSGKAQRTKALLPLLKSAKRAILLSGTPALSRPFEVFWQLHALNPDQWADPTDFHKRYCSGPSSARKEDESGAGKYTGASNLEELHTLLRATLMLRRNKKAILKELPVKRRLRRRIAIDDPELAVQLRADLDEFRERASELAELSSNGRVVKRARSMDDLRDADVTSREMAAHKKALLMELFRRSGHAKLPAVERRVAALLASPEQGKLLVFAHHRAVLDALASGCLRDVPHVRIDGSTPARERQFRVMRFQNQADIVVALLGITAAGVALTLTAASRVLFAELYWTPAALLQAEDRVHRIGQTSEVVVEYLLADDCVDDVLWPCIQHKMLLLGELFENQKQHTMCAADVAPDVSAVPNRKRKTAEDEIEELPTFELRNDSNDDSATLIHLEELEELHHEDPEARDFLQTRGSLPSATAKYTQQDAVASSLASFTADDRFQDGDEIDDTDSSILDASPPRVDPPLALCPLPTTEAPKQRAVENDDDLVLWGGALELPSTTPHDANLPNCAERTL